MNVFLKMVPLSFIQTVLLILLRFLADKTENTLDDQLVDAIEDALK